MKFEEVEVNSERWFDLTLLQSEEFKDISGYENLYKISNYGRIISLNKTDKHKSKILKNRINANGYYHVSLTKNKKAKNKSVHRLMMEMFIPNPNNYPCVNHIDGNKLNNNFNNLEWCSYSYNTKHAYKNNMIKRNIKSNKALIDCNIKKTKKIIQYDLKGNFIKQWDSVTNASKYTKIMSTNICACCKGKFKQMGGYKWKYANDNN